MILKSISYSEFIGEPKEWHVSPAPFDNVNLIVGKNATGKSRFLNVINSLANLISGSTNQLFTSGSYEAKFDNNGVDWVYKVAMHERKISSEFLSIDGELRLTRQSGGNGKIYSSTFKNLMDFNTPEEGLAVVYRRDSIQHPFLEELFKWGQSTCLFLFGSDFDKNELLMISSSAPDSNIARKNKNYSHVVQVLDDCTKKFGTEFLDSVVIDINKIGYNIESIGNKPISEIMSPNGSSPLGLAVKESDLSDHTNQLHMSQGMHRAISIIVHINKYIFEKRTSTLLIDDIGEGLDFYRSKSLINLLIEKIQSSSIQVFMTSNDVFVMNYVDLDYWNILLRKNNVVSSLNRSNSKDLFDDFKFLGLNNFDFFKDNMMETFH